MVTPAHRRPPSSRSATARAGGGDASPSEGTDGRAGPGAVSSAPAGAGAGASPSPSPPERPRRRRVGRAAIDGAPDDATPDDAATPAPAPGSLPRGRALELPGRGTTWIHEHRGPAVGPGAGQLHAGLPLLLLHGWTVTAATNWYPSFPALGRRHRVVAIDHRGHGRGIRSTTRFRLADCADDAVAAADELGIDRFVAVGYSMGGPIAQLIWHRHRDRVAGLVLCATASTFRGRTGEGAFFSMMGGLSVAARVAPDGVRARVADRLAATRFDRSTTGRWAMAEVRRNDPRAMVEAGHAIGRFSSASWIGEVDVPAAVLVTAYDSVVPTARQRALAAAVPAADVYPVAGDHGVCVLRPQVFVPSLAAACRAVSDRALAPDRARLVETAPGTVTDPDTDVDHAPGADQPPVGDHMAGIDHPPG